MLKILWKMISLSTILYYLMLDFYVKTGIRFSLRDKRLFEITEVEITRVDCTVISVFHQNPVGAGRYDVQKWEEAQHRNGHSSVFKAKTGKLSPAMEKFLK